MYSLPQYHKNMHEVRVELLMREIRIVYDLSHEYLLIKLGREMYYIKDIHRMSPFSFQADSVLLEVLRKDNFSQSFYHVQLEHPEFDEICLSLHEAYEKFVSKLLPEKTTWTKLT